MVLGYCKGFVVFGVYRLSRPRRIATYTLEKTRLLVDHENVYLHLKKKKDYYI